MSTKEDPKKGGRSAAAKRAAERPTIEEVGKVERSLPCKLTQAEVVEKADEMTALHAEVHKLEIEKKGHNDRLKTAIDHTEAAINEIVSMIRTRTEVREVECTEVHDHENHLVHVRRDDLGEIIDTRTMTEEERQPTLFKIEGGKISFEKDKKIETVTLRTPAGKVTLGAQQLKTAAEQLAADLRAKQADDEAGGGAPE